MKLLASLGWTAAAILALCFLAGICALAVLADSAGVVRRWRKRRDLHIREKDLARFNMTAFRGAKKFEQ